MSQRHALLYYYPVLPHPNLMPHLFTFTGYTSCDNIQQVRLLSEQLNPALTLSNLLSVVNLLRSHWKSLLYSFDFAFSRFLLNLLSLFFEDQQSLKNAKMTGTYLFPWKIVNFLYVPLLYTIFLSNRREILPTYLQRFCFLLSFQRETTFLSTQVTP